MPPWGLQETSEPVVFTAQGPIPFSMAPQLIANMQGGGAGGQGTNCGQRTTSSRSRTSQPTRPAGRPDEAERLSIRPRSRLTGRQQLPRTQLPPGPSSHPTPRTGGTTSRSSVAGSRKKAVASELDALKRHLRKGRDDRHVGSPAHPRSGHGHDRGGPLQGHPASTWRWKAPGTSASRRTTTWLDAPRMRPEPRSWRRQIQVVQRR